MKIEIDPSSGFCFGVIKVIEFAEKALAQDGKLYCLGDIVHNNMEVERLKKKGLEIIDREKFKDLRNCKVLIRAHGEPPETYEIAERNGITLIDGTCPVVLTLQKRIHKANAKLSNEDGQVIIFGKKGHAEVVGLSGHTGNQAVIIESEEDLNKIDYNKPMHLFAQTTMNKTGYEKIRGQIIKRIAKDRNILECTDSICGQVSNRSPKIRSFAQLHDVIVFVSGKKSSNGKMLFEECRKVNSNSYFVSDKTELKPEWFLDKNSTGICGATSTPKWLMEEIAGEIKRLI